MKPNAANIGINRSRIARGLSAQSLLQVLQAVVRLAEVPLLLSIWGAELYGEWLILSAIPAYFLMADGGFSGAACRAMSLRGGAGDQKGVLSVFQSTWVLLIFVSALVAFSAFIIVSLADLKAWFGFSAIDAGQIKLVVYLFIAHVLIVFQETMLVGAFWSSGRYPLSIFLSSITHLLEFGGLVAGVLFGGGPVEAAMGYAGGRLCGTILMRRILKQVCPWICYGFGRVSLQELKKLSAPALASLALPFGNALNIQGMRIIIGIAFGPSAVAVFTTMRTLSRLALQPGVLINKVIEPELGLAFGSGDSAQFDRLFKLSCQIAFWGSMSASVLLASVTNWIYPLWTNGTLIIQWPLYFLLIGAVVANSLWYTALMVPYATNRHGRIALAYASIYGIATIVLGYWGIRIWGFISSGFVLFFVELVMSVYIIRVATTMVRQRPCELLKAMALPPLFLVRDCIAAFRRAKVAHLR